MNIVMVGAECAPWSKTGVAQTQLCAVAVVTFATTLGVSAQAGWEM